MSIGSIIRKARKAKGMTLEQAALIIGTDSGNLSRLERDKQGVSKELLAKVLDAFEISLSANGVTEEHIDTPLLSETNYAIIPQYSAQAECGDGYLNDHVVVRDSDIAFKRSLIRRLGVKPENLFMIHAKGDSMEPYIFEGDIVVFDQSDTNPSDRDVYVIRRPDGKLSIKRLYQQLSGAWLIRSDNPVHPEEKVSATTLHEIPIIGRVIWRGGEM